jgi:Zn-dependent protease
MMKSWRLGTVLGFPVDLNLSFLLLLGLVFVAFGGFTGVVLVSLVFASVVLHELGHALVARQLGVQVSGIELSFFGGAAKMVQLPRTATHELVIAAAGPAVSLMLGGAGLGLASLFHSPLLGWLGWTNLVLAGFNLIPALPMDGGRILRALLTRKMDFVRATDVAVKVARVVAVAFGLIGLTTGAYQLLLLAPFLWLMGSREQVLARMMADRYAYGRDGYVERTARWGEDRWGDDRPAAPQLRRFTVRQRGGRLVIEEL